MLSPTDTEGKGSSHRGTPRLYFFLTMFLHVRRDASLASLLSIAKTSPGLELVDYDEDSRRVLLRVDPASLHFVKTLIAKYVDAGTFEVKATMHRRIPLDKLRAVADRMERHRGRVLALLDCSSGTVFVEQRREGTLLKYCRRVLIKPLPSQIPPSICSFMVGQDDPVEVYGRARECLLEVATSLTR